MAEEKNNVLGVKIEHLRNSIDSIENYVDALKKGQDSIVKAVTKLTAQMEEFLSVKSNVQEHDRKLVEHSVKIESIEKVLKSYDSIREAVNKNTLITKIGTWIITALISGGISIAVLFFKPLVE